MIIVFFMEKLKSHNLTYLQKCLTLNLQFCIIANVSYLTKRGSDKN